MSKHTPGTSTDRQCVPMQGLLVHCNVRLSAGSLQRLVHSVGKALRRWTLHNPGTL